MSCLFFGGEGGCESHRLRRDGAEDAREFCCPWHPLQGHGRTRTKEDGGALPRLASWRGRAIRAGGSPVAQTPSEAAGDQERVPGWARPQLEAGLSPGSAWPQKPELATWAAGQSMFTCVCGTLTLHRRGDRPRYPSKDPQSLSPYHFLTFCPRDWAASWTPRPYSE